MSLLLSLITSVHPVVITIFVLVVMAYFLQREGTNGYDSETWEKIPALGRALPFIGNAWQFIGASPSVIWKVDDTHDVPHTYTSIDLAQRVAENYGHMSIVRASIGSLPWVSLNKATGFEAILKGNAHLEKGDSYQLIAELTGNGLLTESAHSWRVKRRMLNPAFHLSVLTSFLVTMNEKSG